MTAELTLAPAPAAATVQQQGALSAPAPAARTEGEQQITLRILGMNITKFFPNGIITLLDANVVAIAVAFELKCAISIQ